VSGAESIHEIFRRRGIGETWTIAVSVFAMALGVANLIVPIVFFFSSVPFKPAPLSWLCIALLSVAPSILLGAWHFRRVYRRRQFSIGIPLDSGKARSEPFVHAFNGLLAACRISEPVGLRYNPLSEAPNGRVRIINKGRQVIVTKGLLELFSRDRDAALFILAHEVSHVELGDIQQSSFLRYFHIVYLYCLTAVALFLFFAFATPPYLTFTDEDGLPVYGLHWNWPPQRLFTAISASYVLFLVSSLLTYYYVVRREFAHDFRAAQLVQRTGAILPFFSKGFKIRSWVETQRRRIFYFLQFHPTPEARLKNLENRDPFFVDPLLYPALCAAFILYVPVIIWAVIGRFTGEGATLNLINVCLTGLSLFALLRSDTARFAASQENKTASWGRVFFYGLAYCLGLIPYGTITTITAFIGHGSVNIGASVLQALHGTVSLVFVLPLVLGGLMLLHSIAIPAGLTLRLRIAIFYVFGGLACIFAFAVHSYLAQGHWTFAEVAAVGWLVTLILGLGILPLLRWLDRMLARSTP
jgi:Zn-dependent protease with chaperone function